MVNAVRFPFIFFLAFFKAVDLGLKSESKCKTIVKYFMNMGIHNYYIIYKVIL